MFYCLVSVWLAPLQVPFFGRVRRPEPEPVWRLSAAEVTPGRAEPFTGVEPKGDSIKLDHAILRTAHRLTALREDPSGNREAAGWMPVEVDADRDPVVVVAPFGAVTCGAAEWAAIRG